MRLAVVVLAGRWWGSEVALEALHPYGGSVAIAVAVALALLLSPRFGLSRRPPVARRSLDRMAVVAPPRWGVDACCIGVVALLIGGASMHGERFDRLGGRNGGLNRPVAELAAATPIDGARTIPLGPVEWAAQYFGAGSSWTRFVVLEDDPAGMVAAGVGVDSTQVADEANLDAYGLAECYGFHGWTVQTEAVTGALVGRPAELLRYEDGSAGTIVVSWRQRVPGGIERVVVSGRYRSAAGDIAAAAGPATADEALPDEATVAALVWRTAAALADAAHRGSAA